MYIISCFEKSVMNLFHLLQAKDIYRTYFDVTAIDRINFDPDIVEGLKTSKCYDSCTVLDLPCVVSHYICLNWR